jgi:galactosylgalactosylxylosylprotein 3-beta-glucuronosyltransferase 3
MLNLAHYVQCHPSFRYLRVRHKSTVLVVFVIFLIFFLAREWYHNEGQKSSSLSNRDDELVMLRSQVGYLKRKLAKSSLNNVVDSNDKSVPTIYVITPTYKRPVQKAELTRLCHTFLLVPNLHWIVIEDSKITTDGVKNLLANCGVAYTLLNELTPPDQKMTEKDQNWSKPRGVHQRNAGLHWIQDSFRNLQVNHQEGVIYFADDDNTYSLEIFDEMRHTQKVSVWPVGLVGGLMAEKPKVDILTGRVTGWDITWNPTRPYGIDMAGFAVNLKLFLSKPKAKFAYKVRRGYQESEFLKHLATLEELEPKAEMCSKVLVWHTRAERVDIGQEKRRKEKGLPVSDHGIEV